MVILSRRTVLAGASLALAIPGRAARALEPIYAATLMGVQDADAFLKRAPGFLAIAPWGPASDRLWAVCLADEDHAVSAAIIQEDADGKGKRIVAGPVDADVLSIDPFWTLSLSISPLFPLGAGIPAFGVTVSNSYLSTGRSSGSESMSIFLREGATLRQVFRGFVQASSSEVVDCRRPRPNQEPCRMSWSHAWTIKAAGPSVGGKPPTLIVVAKPSKGIVSRHVWRNDQYWPDSFEKM